MVAVQIGKKSNQSYKKFTLNICITHIFNHRYFFLTHFRGMSKSDVRKYAYTLLKIAVLYKELYKPVYVHSQYLQYKDIQILLVILKSKLSIFYQNLNYITILSFNSIRACVCNVSTLKVFASCTDA